jgi:hypothetical protein
MVPFCDGTLVMAKPTTKWAGSLPTVHWSLTPVVLTGQTSHRLVATSP